MFLCEFSWRSDVAIVTLKKPTLLGSNGLLLEHALHEIDKSNARAIIFDVSETSNMSAAGLGGLVEMLMKLDRTRLLRSRSILIGLCGLSPKAKQLVEQLGLEQVIHIFHNIESAQQSQQFKAHQLRGVRGIVLCAGPRPKLAPLTSETPVATLDYLGRPILGRIMDHATRFGVSNFVINTGHLDTQVLEFARGCTRSSVFCVRELAWQNGPSDFMSSLAHLKSAHDCFEADTIVFFGNVLSDLDLSDLLMEHRTNHADVTFAVAVEKKRRPKAQQDSERAIFSAFVMSRQAAEVLEYTKQKMRGVPLYSAFVKLGLSVHLHVSDHQMTSIECGADYFASQAASLRNHAFGIRPVGEEIEEGTWVADDANVGRSVAFQGTTYIGARSRIGNGSMLQGCNMVGADCEVEAKSLLFNSLLRPQTKVSAGTIVDHMIASADWAINHRFANGDLQNRTRLDGVISARTAKIRTAFSGEGLARIA